MIFVGMEDSRRGVSKEVSVNDLLYETIEDLIDDVIFRFLRVPEGDL